ncbi:NAD(P)/FAD-dependent oxidoreductase [Flavisphingomonas formosensis]|uniref:NAD(P)/FAD-dependent oxidoreductase n=1 Tax=Flavisphingomonas formosensis TaxID=861534 RepID=UPI0012FA8C56|nr:FAD-dependent monooxygenase [Sphingomonas formosensis]
MRRTAALIAGGGPAGAAAAIALARQGLRPVLLEREREARDIVCGGFLGWDALEQLGALGIDAAALGARPIERMRLVAGTSEAAAPLPGRAAGLSRRTLDTALLRAAADAGAGLEGGVRLRSADDERLRVALADGAEFGCGALFLATGKHELRGLARPHGRPPEALAIGLRTTLAGSAALERMLAGVIELHLFDGGYAGLLLQEDGRANLCLSVSAARFAGLTPGRLLEDIAAEAPLLAARIGAAAGIGGWSAVAGVPYGWRARTGSSGLFRIGDQAAVIASLAGDGIAIALSSGQLAATSLLRDGPEGAIGFQARFGRRVALPLAIAGILRTIAERRPRLRAGLLSLFRHAPGLTGIGARLTRAGTPPNPLSGH